MTSQSFDWSQFEEMADESGSSGASPFSWDQFESVDEPVSDLIKTAPPISKEKLGRNVMRTGATVGSTIAGLPGDIASFLGRGLNLVADQFGKGKSPEELQEIVENPFTSVNIRRKIEQSFPDLAPKDPQEKEWDDALSLMTSFAIPVPGGQAAKAVDPRTMSQLYKFGRQLGLTEKELTPLIQGKAKAGLLGKIAAKTKSMKETLRATGDKLGKAYENLDFHASTLPSLSQSAAQGLANQYKRLVKGWENTLAKSPDTEAAINFANKAIGALETSGANPASLINFTGEIGKAVNWNSIKNGKKMLAALKEPAKNLLRKEQPYIGKALDNIDSLYSSLKNFERLVGLKKINQYRSYDESTKKMVDFAFKYGPYAALSLGKLKTAGAAALAPHVATQLLTNPKLQNLHKKMLSSIKNGSYKAAPKLIQTWERITGQDMDEALSEENEE